METNAELTTALTTVTVEVTQEDIDATSATTGYYTAVARAANRHLEPPHVASLEVNGVFVLWEQTSPISWNCIKVYNPEYPGQYNHPIRKLTEPPYTLNRMRMPFSFPLALPTACLRAQEN